MILGADKARLSKRHGATSVMAYKDMGFLPEALVNYLVRLGWSHGDQEIFNIDELVREFSLEAVGKSPAVFNPEKLLWLNQHYIKSYPQEKLLEAVTPFWTEKGFDLSDTGFVGKAIETLRTRSRTIVEMADSSAFFFKDEVDYEAEAADKFLTPEYLGHLQAVVEKLSDIADYSKEGIEVFLRALADERGIKLKWLAQTLRVALTGKTVSPGIDEIMAIIGRKQVERKIRRAISCIEQRG
jgi:glutamyl-tRNA synthetase